MRRASRTAGTAGWTAARRRTTPPWPCWNTASSLTRRGRASGSRPSPSATCAASRWTPVTPRWSPAWRRSSPGRRWPAASWRRTARGALLVARWADWPTCVRGSRPRRRSRGCRAAARRPVRRCAAPAPQSDRGPRCGRPRYPATCLPVRRTGCGPAGRCQRPRSVRPTKVVWLPRRSFRPHRAGVEEVARPQREAGPLDAHAGPVLRPRQVVQVQRVPQHHVGAVDRLVVQVARQEGAQRPAVVGVLLGVVAGHPEVGLGEPLGGGAAVDSAGRDQLIGARQAEAVLRLGVDHPPAAEALGAERPRRLPGQPRPAVLAGTAARLVLAVVELLDHVAVSAVDVEVEAIIDVVDVRWGEEPVLTHQRAERRRLAGAGVLQRPGQADLRRQLAVLAEVPAADVAVAVQVVGAPQHQRLAVGAAEVAEVGEAGGLLVHHDDAAALGLALGVVGQAGARGGDAVLAGEQLDQALADAVAEVLRARRASVVRHEDLGHAGVLEDGAAGVVDVLEDQAVARVDRPGELPALPADLPAVDAERGGRLGGVPGGGRWSLGGRRRRR